MKLRDKQAADKAAHVARDRKSREEEAVARKKGDVTVETDVPTSSGKEPMEAGAEL
jgi:hypothetical protein